MKTLDTVIMELQQIRDYDPSLGSAPVYVIADHGQTFIQCNDVSIDHTFEYDYYAEAYLTEELDSAEMHVVKPFITIGD